MTLPFVISWISAGIVLAATPEESCQYGRVKAAAKYAKCIQTEVGKRYVGSSHIVKIVRCWTNYGKAWDKLQAKALTSPQIETCDAARYVDNGDGTVTDNLSTLQWEKKTDDTTAHDKDNGYTWSSSGTPADGTAFTTFLPALNSPGFAGHHDWRLPTQAELLTIAEPGYPDCTVPPCIDPIFGPTVSGIYWSGVTRQDAPDGAWSVRFDEAVPNNRLKTESSYVRAVRGGF